MFFYNILSAHPVVASSVSNDEKEDLVVTVVVVSTHLPDHLSQQQAMSDR